MRYDVTLANIEKVFAPEDVYISLFETMFSPEGVKDFANWARVPVQPRQARLP